LGPGAAGGGRNFPSLAAPRMRLEVESIMKTDFFMDEQILQRAGGKSKKNWETPPEKAAGADCFRQVCFRFVY
jgi:hypothetical protein